MPCIIIDSCVFYKNLERMQAEQQADHQAEFMKTHICLSDFTQCARYKIRRELGETYVPPDLSPVNFEQASEIIRTFKRQERKKIPGEYKPKKPSPLDFD